MKTPIIPAEAKAHSEIRHSIKTVILVALCCIGVAILALSHFVQWVVPILQAGGVIALVVIAAIAIDREVRK